MYGSLSDLKRLYVCYCYYLLTYKNLWQLQWGEIRLSSLPHFHIQGVQCPSWTDSYHRENALARAKAIQQTMQVGIQVSWFFKSWIFVSYERVQRHLEWGRQKIIHRCCKCRFIRTWKINGHSCVMWLQSILQANRSNSAEKTSWMMATQLYKERERESWYRRFCLGGIKEEGQNKVGRRNTRKKLKKKSMFKREIWI